eukprot:COSAG01_NODE_1175_length_11334_cov_23.401152_5_plen_513_part_00
MPPKSRAARASQGAAPLASPVVPLPPAPAAGSDTVDCTPALAPELLPNPAAATSDGGDEPVVAPGLQDAALGHTAGHSAEPALALGQEQSVGAEEGVPPERASSSGGAGATPPADPTPSPLPLLLGRETAVAELCAALELSGARALVHGELGVGRRALMREVAARQSSHLRRQWWVSGHSDEALLEGLASFGREHGACPADADSAAALAAARLALSSGDDDWLLLVEDVCKGSSVLAHVPMGRGRCLFSSESNPSIWGGAASQLLTYHTALQPLPPVECMQLLCRTAMQQLPNAGGPTPRAEAEAIIKLSSTASTSASASAARQLCTLLHDQMGRLTLGAVVLGTAMQSLCHDDDAPAIATAPLDETVDTGQLESQPWLSTAMVELCDRLNSQDDHRGTAWGVGAGAGRASSSASSSSGSLASSLQAQLRSSIGDALETVPAAAAAGTAGAAGQPIALVVMVSYGLIAELAPSAEAAVTAYSLLECLVALGDASVAGVPEQVRCAIIILMIT